MNKRNYRIEKTMKTDRFVAADGTIYEVTYACSEHSAYDTDCLKCGVTYTVKGIMGALLYDKQCPDCFNKDKIARD